MNNAQQVVAVDVTDEMAEIVIEAVYGDSWCDYSRTAEVRKAMSVALSSVASRDREDAPPIDWYTLEKWRLYLSQGDTSPRMEMEKMLRNRPSNESIRGERKP